MHWNCHGYTSNESSLVKPLLPTQAFFNLYIIIFILRLNHLLQRAGLSSPWADQLRLRHHSCKSRVLVLTVRGSSFLVPALSVSCVQVMYVFSWFDVAGVRKSAAPFPPVALASKRSAFLLVNLTLREFTLHCSGNMGWWNQCLRNEVTWLPFQVVLPVMCQSLSRESG